jgi:hypothetical protein
MSISAVPAKAAATTTTSAQTVTVSVHQDRAEVSDAADTTCPIYYNYFATYDSTCSGTLWTCTTGYNSTLYPPVYVSSGCEWRVWLYQNSNRAGYSLCISPHTATGHLNRSYRSFHITSTGSAC